MAEIGEGVNSGKAGKASTCEATSEGHPIDVATGNVFTVAKDLTFTGQFSISLFRTWQCINANKRGIFGLGWTSFLDLSVEIFNDEIVFCDDEGREIRFPLVNIGDSFYKSCEDLTLIREKDFIKIRSGNGRSYLFFLNPDSPKNVLSEITNENYDIIYLEYEDGKLVGITDAGNKLYRLDYDSKQRLIGIYCHVDIFQKEVRLRGYQYDINNRLIEEYDELSHAFRYEYDSYNRLIKETDRNGYSFYYEYDAEGRCIKNHGDNDEYYRKFKYFPSQHKTEVFNSFQQKTTYYWNNVGLVTLVVDAAGGIRQYHYDNDRKLIGEIDENHNTITYDYDDKGRKTIRIDQENNQWETIDGKYIIEELDPLGNKVKRLYDDHNNLILKYDEQGNQQEYRYWLNGEIFGGYGDTDKKIYDEWKRLLCQKDILGNEKKYEYDVKGRLVRKIDKNGNPITYGYDAEDNLIWIKNALGDRRRFVYKGFNKNIEEQDENGHSIKFEFDSEENLKTIINENGEKHYFNYDGLNRLISDEGFDGQIHTYKYDSAGNITQVNNADGSVLYLSYDKVGRLINIKGITTEGKKYQNSYKYNAAGNLIEAINEHSVVKFEYDSLGRIIKEYQNEKIIEKNYNSDGNLISIKNPWGSVVTFNYNECKRLSEVILPGNKTIQIVRNELGQPIEDYFPNGIYSQCVHDAENRLISQSITHNDKSLVQRKYKYDSRNKLTYLKDKTRGTKEFKYDKAGRLTEVIYSAGETETFEYDPAGNRMNSVNGQKTKIERGNRLVSADGYDYEYDLRGNLIRKKNSQSSLLFCYNSFNQLIYFESSDGKKGKYYYDALGRRICKEILGGKKVKFYWDQFRLLGEECNENLTEYIFHPNHFVPISFIENDRAYFYHNDHLGTPQEITDEKGKIVWSGGYKAYGYCRVTAISKIINNFRFQGQYFDSETGLHYNVFRYYDSFIGRYITRDPVKYFSDDFNLYCYVKNDPLNLIDPLGLEPVSAAYGTYLAYVALAALGVYVYSQREQIAEATIAVGGAVVDGVRNTSQAISNGLFSKSKSKVKEKSLAKAEEKCTEREKTEPCPVCGIKENPTPGITPPYVTQNRVPLDSETFPPLNGPGYSRTKNIVKGATVFRAPDGTYQHRDTLHRGKAAEIEVYDKNGKHLYAKCPHCGAPKPGSTHKERKIKV